MSARKSFLRSLPVMLCDREGKNSRDVESIPAFKVIVSWELKCAHIVMPWETFTLSGQMTTIPWPFWRFQKNNYCIKVSVNLLWNTFWKRGSLALKNGLFLLLPLPQLCYKAKPQLHLIFVNHIQLIKHRILLIYQLPKIVRHFYYENLYFLCFNMNSANCKGILGLSEAKFC